MKKKCVQCGRLQDVNCHFCPNCGTKMADAMEENVYEEPIVHVSSENKNRKVKLIQVLGGIGLIFVLTIVFIIARNNIIVPYNKLNTAMKMIQTEEYENAYNLLLELDNNKKAQKELKKFEYKLMCVTDQNGVVKEEYSYNQQGQCIERIVTRSKNSYEKTTYKYDQCGNCIREEYEEYMNIKRVDDRTTDFKYDEAGRMIEKICRIGKQKTHYYYEYNEKNMVGKEKSIIQDADGTSEYITAYKYIFNEDDMYLSNDDFDILVVQQYDAKGNLIWKQLSNQEHYESYRYYYDEKNNLIKESVKDGYSDPYTVYYTFDADNYCIEKKITNGSEEDIVKYIYDDCGNKIQAKFEHYASYTEEETYYFSETENYAYQLFYISN